MRFLAAADDAVVEFFGSLQVARVVSQNEEVTSLHVVRKADAAFREIAIKFVEQQSRFLDVPRPVGATLIRCEFEGTLRREVQAVVAVLSLRPAGCHDEESLFGFRQIAGSKRAVGQLVEN